MDILKDKINQGYISKLVVVRDIVLGEREKVKRGWEGGREILTKLVVVYTYLRD